MVLFAVIFGVALLSIPGKQSKPLLDLLGALQEVCMTVVKGAMLLAPFAVFGLMAQLTSNVGFDVLLGMGVYVLTVFAGLLSILVLYLGILAMVLGSVGVPVGGLALILGVDRILDMARSAVNVTGDLVACVVMDRWVGGTKTAKEELTGEAEIEKEREKTGEDVIISPGVKAL